MNKKVLYAILLNLSCISAANAQTVLTLGVQEIYDDNIYLEDDKKIDLSAVPNLPKDFKLPEQIDGNPQDDLITNVYLGASGDIPLSSAIKSSGEIKLGTLIFADQTDESRLTLDGLLTLDSEKSLIPAPFSISIINSIKSQSNGIGVADGTSTKQSETYSGSIVLGANDMKLSNTTDLDIGYTFNYNKFLEDFTFNNKNEEDLGAFENRIKSTGSDYFVNAVNASLTELVTENFEAGLFSGFNNYTYTNVESAGSITLDESDLDRNEAVGGVKGKYLISKELTFGANVGVNYSRLKNEPDAVTVPVQQADGSIENVTFDGQQDDTALIFGANLAYSPNASTNFMLTVDQNRRTDVDGDRLITRTVGLDGTKSIGDRWKLSAGGRYLQYNIGDSLDNPTDRFDVTTAIQYSLTESIALSCGWNYTKQDADKSNASQTLFDTTDDYEGNRFFIGISSGLIGKAS